MNKNGLFSKLLLLTLLLSACSNGNSPTEISTSETTSGPAVTEQASTRQAVLSEVKNNVSARQSSDQDLSPATNGMSIFLSGGIETGDNGRVRLDLLPEGTIVRVGPNSSFTLPVLTEENGLPKTKIELLFGKVFILLKGGSLDVQTPSGVASVRGSLLSVQYNVEKSRIEAACLEGHCSLQNENGDDVELTDGQESYIEGDEEPPSDPQAINREDIQDWLDENPDLQDYMDDVPNPEDYPEDSEDTDLPDANGENNGGNEPESEEPSSYIPMFDFANIAVALHYR